MASQGPYRREPPDELDELFGRANPNPERVGCPSGDVLRALARRERPIEDPAYEHLAKCSECYREFRRLHPIAGEPEGAARRPAHLSAISWFAAAAAILLLVVGAWFFLAREDSAPGDVARIEEPAPPELRVEIDLRPYTVVRSEQERDERPPVTLPRERFNATVFLPVGSEPGRYEIQVLDSDLRAHASATGDAQIRDFITTLETALDLQELAPGRYQLALRREGDDWRLFPAEVK